MTSAAISSQKSILRKSLLRQRKKLPLRKKTIFNQQIAIYLLRYFESYNHVTIGAYLSFDGEPDITEPMRQLHTRGHRIAVPCIDPVVKGKMQFYDWAPNVSLCNNRYGIPEPATTPAHRPISCSDFDALLVPLLGFDALGHRLGMGGGYYDRWLSHASQKQPERIGIAYHWQQQTLIPFDTMDQPLHRVVTDQGVIDCPSL